MIKLNWRQRATLVIGTALLVVYLAFAAPWLRFLGRGSDSRPDGIVRSGLISSPQNQSSYIRFELAMGQTILEASVVVLLTAGAVFLLGTREPPNSPPD